MTTPVTTPETQASTALKVPRVIAVASGKGGVGKTWFSITLSHALTRLGKRVLLFDADLGLANADIQLGLMPEKDLSTAVTGNLPLEKVITHYQTGGFDVIAGRSGSGQLASLPASRLSEIRVKLMELAAKYDHVIIDLGAGVERSVRALAVDADAFLIVSTDEPTSLTDAYTFIKVSLSEKPNTDMRLVVNMAHSKLDGEKTYATLLKACKGFLKFEPKLAGIIRRDRKVSESIRHQTPLLTRHPNTEAAVDVSSIARLLIGEQ
ncbi:MAG: MinD/ParA family protein [Dongiaceae bacterium]